MKTAVNCLKTLAQYSVNHYCPRRQLRESMLRAWVKKIVSTQPGPNPVITRNKVHSWMNQGVGVYRATPRQRARRVFLRDPALRCHVYATLLLITASHRDPSPSKLVTQGEDNRTHKQTDQAVHHRAANHADEDDQHRNGKPAPHDDGFQYII